MKSQIDNMLFKGVFRESHSPWSAPAILVPKRSLDGKPKYRFRVDFRALMRLPNSTRILYPCLRRLCRHYSVPNIFLFWTVIAVSGS